MLTLVDLTISTELGIQRLIQGALLFMLEEKDTWILLSPSSKWLALSVDDAAYIATASAMLLLLLLYMTDVIAHENTWSNNWRD